MTRTRHAVSVGAAVVLIGISAGFAGAADPPRGTVSNSSPSVTWKGQLTNSFITFNAFNQDPSAPCTNPTCDPFALEVADGGANLELRVNLQATAQGGGNGTAGLRVRQPDGKIVWQSGESGPEKAFRIVIRNAPKGAYSVDTVSTFGGTPVNYEAGATLLVPGAALPPPPTTTTPPPSSGQQPGPAAQPAPAAKLTAKAGKASARKLAKKRKLTVKLATTSPLTKLAAVLRKGKKVVAKGKLARLEKSGKLVLRFAKRKLKKGKYTLVVQGTDAQGRTVSATGSAKLAR